MRFLPFLVAGFLAGFVGCFIPWGAADRLHGTGFPIAVVLWDVKGGAMIDYPNPLAYLLNPALGVAFSGLVYVLLRGVLALRKTSHDAARQ